MQKKTANDSVPPRAGKGYLRNAWQRAQRRLRGGLCTVAAAASITCGFNAQAQARTAPHAASVAMHPHHRGNNFTGYAYSRERLQAVEARMRKTPVGQELLQFADDNNVSIKMSNSKALGDKPSSGFTTDGDYGDGTVRLNGMEKNDDQLMLTLVHELRHAWHDLVIQEGKMRLDPAHTIVKRRLLEADVFAFESHFAYEYEKSTGTKLHLGDRSKPCDDEESSLCMLDGYARDRDSGMPVEKAYGRLIARTLEHVHAEGYDADFIRDQDDDWRGIIDDPASGLPLFGAANDDLTSDSDFAATIRRVTTVSLTPGSGPSALADWTDEDILSLKKTSGVNNADVKGLDDEVKKFGEARNAWRAHEKISSHPHNGLHGHKSH